MSNALGLATFKPSPSEYRAISPSSKKMRGIFATLREQLFVRIEGKTRLRPRFRVGTLYIS